ncbi:MAG: hypothetical protein ACK5QD_11650, partial [Brevundimonas sp.]
MSRVLLTACALAALSLAACAGGPVAEPPAMSAPVARPVDYVRDVHSHARPEVARVVDVALDLAADFEASRLSGTATLSITGVPGAQEIILDVLNLDLQAVGAPQGGARPQTRGAAAPTQRPAQTGGREPP